MATQLQLNCNSTFLVIRLDTSSWTCCRANDDQLTEQGSHGGALRSLWRTQQEQPEVDGDAVRGGGGDEGPPGGVVGRGAAGAQDGGQAQEAGVPEGGARALVGVHLA